MEDGLTVMAGAELVGWYQMHDFHVFDNIPCSPFLAIVMSRPPLSSLHWWKIHCKYFIQL